MIEIKTVRALSSHLARSLTSIIEETQAVSANIIDQGDGEDPFSVQVSRKDFLTALDWLP